MFLDISRTRREGESAGIVFGAEGGEKRRKYAQRTDNRI